MILSTQVFGEAAGKSAASFALKNPVSPCNFSLNAMAANEVHQSTGIPLDLTPKKQKLYQRLVLKRKIQLNATITMNENAPSEFWYVNTNKSIALLLQSA